jgi:hypothetical protein
VPASLLRNDFGPRLVILGLLIRRQCGQHASLCACHEGLQHGPLRYAITGRQALQCPFGRDVNQQVDSFTRAIYALEVSRPVGGLSLGIALRHIVPCWICYCVTVRM